MRIINMACRRRKEAHLRVDQYRFVATAQPLPDDPLCAVSQASGPAGCFWRLRDFCIEQADHFISIYSVSTSVSSTSLRGPTSAPRSPCLAGPPGGVPYSSFSCATPAEGQSRPFHANLRFRLRRAACAALPASAVQSLVSPPPPAAQLGRVVLGNRFTQQILLDQRLILCTTEFDVVAVFTSATMPASAEVHPQRLPRPFLQSYILQFFRFCRLVPVRRLPPKKQICRRPWTRLPMYSKGCGPIGAKER
jgi:hypothetical protein